MFTGIVEGLGVLTKVERFAGGAKLTIRRPWDSAEDKIGDSVAVNGICLTIAEQEGVHFTAEMSEETISRTAFENFHAGENVNLERALRLSDRLGGHLVTGHIDSIGVVRSKNLRGNSVVLEIEAAKEIERYLIEKGSVALDGVSLTINACQGRIFGVNIIPHTLGATMLNFRRPGSRVNLEADVIGKYIEKLLKTESQSSERRKIDLGFLAQHGFFKGGT